MRGILVSLLVAVATAHVVSFEDHKVVDVFPMNQRDIKWLLDLPEVTDGVRGIDVWSNDGVLVAGRPNMVRLTPTGFATLQGSNMSFRMIHSDLQANMDRVNSMVDNAERSTDPNAPYEVKDQWFYKWHSYEEIQKKLAEVTQAYKHIAEFFPKIGTSYEGRAISGIKISGASPKKRVVIVSGTHAREWIAEGVTLWAVAALLEQYDTNPEIKQLVDQLEIHLVPCYNPDGYEYSRLHNRYWRKNRSKSAGGQYGVDQNRNWNANWGGSGASHSPSSDTYCGTSAFSEPETKAIYEWLKSFGQNGVAAMLDMHSHAYLLLRPWAYQNSKCPDETRMDEEGKEMVRLISTVRGSKYQNIRASQLYVASGTAGDGGYILGIPTSYVFELGGNDFVVPESEIRAQGKEIFESLKYFFAQALV